MRCFELSFKLQTAHSGLVGRRSSTPHQKQVMRSAILRLDRHFEQEAVLKWNHKKNGRFPYIPYPFCLDMFCFAGDLKWKPPPPKSKLKASGNGNEDPNCWMRRSTLLVRLLVLASLLFCFLLHFGPLTQRRTNSTCESMS